MAKHRTSSMYSIGTSFIHKHYGAHGGNGVMTVNGKYACDISVDAGGMHVAYAIRQDDGTKFNVSQYVPFEVTHCNYGGLRKWFMCPRCARRVGVVYLGYSVACRHCHDLIYPCQADRDKRGWVLYWRILDRIGGVQGIKPKGMHWRTFDRLTTKADKLCRRQALPILKRLERIKEAT